MQRGAGVTRGQDPRQGAHQPHAGGHPASASPGLEVGRADGRHHGRPPRPHHLHHPSHLEGKEAAPGIGRPSPNKFSASETSKDEEGEQVQQSQDPTLPPVGGRE